MTNQNGIKAIDMTNQDGVECISPAEASVTKGWKPAPVGAVRSASADRYSAGNALRGGFIARVSPPAWLYGLVVFTAAWLVFWIQPLAVRDVLPVLGGSPAVWNTAMVFFQAALLAGYAFAHFLVRHVSPTRQIALLGVLWVGVALTAPAGELRLVGDAPGDLPPAIWLLGTLAGSLGIAFVAASSLTPLVQAWLARAGSGAASVDPYFLYAASNAGSAGALLAYPFLLEPLLGLDRQAWLWSAVLLGLAPLLIVLWAASIRGSAPSAAPVPAPDLSARTTLPVVRILALSAVPSALLLAVTQYLTTDVAAVPLLWIVPLALYLGTFVHAFARRQLVSQRVLARALPLALIFLAIVYPFSRTIFAFGFVHLLVFALVALCCHGALARLRPPAADLTRFYLLVSTGGLIGGLLVALVAPVVFVDVYEYPVALALVAALVPAASFALRRVHLIVAGGALVLVVAGLTFVLSKSGGFGESAPTLTVVALAAVVLAAPALLVLRTKPLLLAGALLVVFLVPAAVAPRSDVHVAGERSFFGVYRVTEADGVRTFHHGTTLHGSQWQRADGSIESRTTYYAVETPYGELLSALTRRPSPVTIGMVGLGTGSLACYARPADSVRIYEIDPVVVRLAREHFAALDDCAPDARIAVGDARLLLERERAPLDLLALDAFTSDAIPVHLLSLEAFRTYLRVLAPDGAIGVHISNRHLDLQPALAALAERIGLVGRIKRYSTADDAIPSKSAKPSNVVVLARDEGALRALDLDSGWAELGPPDRVRVWTDDYASIVPILRWW